MTVLVNAEDLGENAVARLIVPVAEASRKASDFDSIFLIIE